MTGRGWQRMVWKELAEDDRKGLAEGLTIGSRWLFLAILLLLQGESGLTIDAVLSNISWAWQKLPNQFNNDKYFYRQLRPAALPGWVSPYRVGSAYRRPPPRPHSQEQSRTAATESPPAFPLNKEKKQIFRMDFSEVHSWSYISCWHWRIL